MLMSAKMSQNWKNHYLFPKSIGPYLSNEWLTNSNGPAVKKLFRVENSSLIMYFLPIIRDNDVITRQWSDEISKNCFYCLSN